MATLGRYVCCGVSLMVLLASSVPVRADQGKDLFEKECAGCHSIGGGDGGGPDLKGVVAKRPVAWLERVIVEPDKLMAEKDPLQGELAKKFGFAMPNLAISRDDAKKLIAYLNGGAPVDFGASAATDNTAVPPGQAPVEVEIIVTPELVASGKALFFGSKPLSKGGASCASCHAFSYPGMQSGNLAADLNGTYAKKGGQGLRGMLKNLKFPIMKKIYADKPLTDDEIGALMAFFNDAAAKKGADTSADRKSTRLNSSHLVIS